MTAMTAIFSALVAAVLLGIATGLLGTFVVVRRMALTGDMLSHAVLPGIVAGFAWSSTRNPLFVLGCAVVAGILGSATMGFLIRTTRLKPDAALALVLSVFFAIGIAMISRFQPAGVQAFLYGQVAAIDRSDLNLLLGVTALTAVLVPYNFRLLRLISFDAPFAKLLGFPVRVTETAFFLLLTVVIVIAMQAVGVVLVTAMLVTPAAAARFCTHSLAKTALIACVIGALGGVIGVAISASRNNLPTGPLMALSVTGLFILAACFGSRRGWIPIILRRRREQLRIMREDILKRLWLQEELRGPQTGLILDSPLRTLSVKPALQGLENTHAIIREADQIRLTPSGREHASELVRAHRLWELYLTGEAAYKPDHVHEAAERAEHWIGESQSRALAAQLGYPTEDPHGKPIPPPTRKEKTHEH